MQFTVRSTASGSRARRGELVTAHATIQTPVFMPVGTRGSVRTQTLADLEQLAPSIILANTYHLAVRPGLEAMTRLGGLHRWMKWPRALLTDSGGFQIFSLSKDTRIDDAGAEVTSRTDGTRLVLTPESSIAMQRAIGSDIMMVLDQCIDSTSPIAQARAAMELTHRWAHRSLAARGDSPNALFAIVQGAMYPALRRESADVLAAIDGFDGYAIGGLAVGESKQQREELAELTAERLPAHKPRYLMGVGTPIDLLEAVHRGLDMFDCVLPTAWAQQGIAFTSRGRVILPRGVYRLATDPLDPACDCPACMTYERSYLHHLVKCREPLGWQLLAHHNLKFYLALMQRIRDALDAGTFAQLYEALRGPLAAADVDNPPGPAPSRKPRRPGTRGDYTVHVSPQGFASIKHVSSGEIMHATNDPDREAEELYVAQSALIERARTARTPITIWDVGLGAGHNALAVLRAFGDAPVTLVSFEQDLDPFLLALDHQKEFPHLRTEAAHRFARERRFAKGEVRWELVLGDFAATLHEAPVPDVVIFDPFSSETNPTMWTLALFRALRSRLARAELFSYTKSTAIRSSLLAAGFRVARGAAAGRKPETTIGLTGDDPAFARHALLDRDWLAKRARSTAKYAADVTLGDRDALDALVAAHPQFRG